MSPRATPSSPTMTSMSTSTSTSPLEDAVDRTPRARAAAGIRIRTRRTCSPSRIGSPTRMTVGVVSATGTADSRREPKMSAKQG